MMLKNAIMDVVKSQKEDLNKKKTGVEREIYRALDLESPHAIIISGIRRCGKSTLMRQIMKKIKNYNFINFEDQLLMDFKVEDFEKLDEIFLELSGQTKYYFLDEIQNVPGWERFVRKMQDLGKKFVITGSNASLLSKELGTKLTGRHITKELFPFSYSEMLKLKNKSPSQNSLNDYLENGGFPEYLLYGNKDSLQQVFNDIILRDIVVRHKLREEKAIKDIATFLFTNSGSEISFNGLRKLFNLGSTNSVSTYVHYFEESYLLFLVPKFSYSYKKQIANPKKVYAVDTGLASANSASFSKDKGKMLETAVFANLRRKNKDIYFFREKKECDFLIKEEGKITQAIQVCYEVNDENKEREISGLKEAMAAFGLKEGIIVTFNQKDRIGNIKLIPAYEWLLN